MNIISFEPFPELLTNKFQLRKLKTNDATKIFAMRSDKEVAKFLNRPLAKTIDDGSAFIKKVNDAISKNELIYWGIVDKDDSEIIGTITLWQISEDGLEAEIGFELFPKFQGAEIMKEVVAEVIRFAFEEMKLSKIRGEVDPDNVKSISLLKRFGFIFGSGFKNTDVYYLRKTI